jgi:hypothetical protein
MAGSCATPLPYDAGRRFRQMDKPASLTIPICQMNAREPCRDDWFSGLQSSVCAFANAGRAAKLLLDHRAQLRQVVLQDLPRAATTDPGSCSWRYSLLIVRKPEIAWLVQRSCRQTKSRYEIISGPLIDSTVRRGSNAAPWSKMMPRPTPARTAAITPS